MIQKYLQTTLILIILTILPLQYCSGQSDEGSYFIKDEKSLNDQISKLITQENFIDTTIAIKAIFVLKVDSLGEVTSAHVRWSRNLKFYGYYDICRKIESEFKVPFLYPKYRENFLNGKYIYARIPVDKLPTNSD